MTGARRGWALTDGLAGQQQLLYTADGGVSWADRTPPRAADVGNMDEEFGFYDSRHAWMSVFGSKAGATGVWHTGDGGKSWSWTGTEMLLGDFKFRNASHGVACSSDYGLGNAYYRFFETGDGGQHWRPVIITAPGPQYSAEPAGTLHLCNLCTDEVTYSPPGRVLITHGDMGDEQPKGVVRMSLSTDLGSNWRELSFPLPPQDRLGGLVTGATPRFIDATHGWLTVNIATETANGNALATQATAFYTTQDGGETWNYRSEPVARPSGDLYAVCLVNFISAGDAFMVINDRLQATRDGGKTWRVIKPDIDLGQDRTKRRVAQLDFVDNRHGWVVIGDDAADGEQLYKTADGGVTWQELAFREK